MLNPLMKKESKDMKEEGKYFDRVQFLNDVSDYMAAAEGLTSMLKKFEELDLGEISDDILSKIVFSFDELEETCLQKQLSTSGKNALIKGQVAGIYSDKFDRFRAFVNNIMETRRGYCINRADLSLMRVKGTEVVFTGEEALIQKHTYEAKTETQKQFVEQVNKVLTELEALREIVGDVPIIDYDGCFHLDGKDLIYNRSAITMIA